MDSFDLSVYKIAVETPLIESLPISKHTPNCNVYLKLENTQPCGSFKQRGIGLRCLKVTLKFFRTFICLIENASVFRPKKTVTRK